MIGLLSISRTANALGIALPPSLLALANELNRIAGVDVAYWHLSAVRGTASSRQLLEVERTCRRPRRTDAIDPSETSADKFAVMHKRCRECDSLGPLRVLG